MPCGIHPQVLPLKYPVLRRHLGAVFRKLAEQKESRIEEGHLMPDQVHMMIAIPPTYAVSQVIEFIKRKSAVHLARAFGKKKRNFVGQHLLGARVLSIHRSEGGDGDPVSISGGRKTRTSMWTKSACGANRPPERWSQPSKLALATPPAALSGSQFKSPCLWWGDLLRKIACADRWPTVIRMR
jgi:putative transposase